MKENQTMPSDLFIRSYFPLVLYAIFLSISLIESFFNKKIDLIFFAICNIYLIIIFYLYLQTKIFKLIFKDKSFILRYLTYKICTVEIAYSKIIKIYVKQNRLLNMSYGCHLYISIDKTVPENATSSIERFFLDTGSDYIPLGLGKYNKFDVVSVYPINNEGLEYILSSISSKTDGRYISYENLGFFEEPLKTDLNSARTLVGGISYGLGLISLYIIIFFSVILIIMFVVLSIIVK